MHRFTVTALAYVCLICAGCSTTVPLNYIPSSSIRGSGTVSLTTFKYIPAEQGIVEQNEFQKALGCLQRKQEQDDACSAQHPDRGIARSDLVNDLV